MTFDEAGLQYGQLRQAWQAGQITAEHFQGAVAQLRVIGPDGQWWALDAASGQWLVWNGSAWRPFQAPAPPAYPPPLAAPPAAQRVVVAPTAPVPSGPSAVAGIGTALMTVIPGLAIDFMQRGAYYRANPTAAVPMVAPPLVSALAMALAPLVGRIVAVGMVLGCLAWLAWPAIAGTAGVPPSTPGAPGGPLADHAGRGLVGMSMLYMIPRIWQAGKR
jgi:hypothetical protein